jgi:hypothetical protein
MNKIAQKHMLESKKCYTNKTFSQANFLKLLFLLLIVCFVYNSLQAQQDKGNEYRITLFPSAKITDKITGFAYLGYVWNPEKNYQTYYLGWPAACYTAKPWLQIWGGIVGLYTNNENSADKLELRPFIGPKFFLPNKLKWNIYNFTRYEFRATQDRTTHEWSNTSRLRSRFGVEIPFSKLEKAWKPGNFYGMADVEPYYRFDRNQVDPFRIRGGVGYIMKSAPLRLEFIYHAQFTHPSGSDGLEFTDNIYRLNIKIALNHGIISSLQNPDLDE